jgi:putative ABC transport system substrate-binding protein
MIGRREFITLLGGAAVAWPLAARAQQRRRISILHSGFPNRTPIHVLFAALRTLGYEDGRTATIELLGGEGDPDRLNTLVAKLAAQSPDVIIALTEPAVIALKHANLTTPVVFAFVTDPVGLGIVKSLAHPGGNFTGLSFSDAALGGKRLELLIDTLPNIQRVAVIWTRTFAGNSAIFDAIREAARVRRVEIFPRELHGADDLLPAFDDAKASGSQAAIFMTDNVMFGRRKEVAALALARHLPSIHSFTPEAEDGGFDVLRARYRRELQTRCRSCGRDSQGRASGQSSGRGADSLYTGREYEDGGCARHHTAPRDSRAC